MIKHCSKCNKHGTCRKERKVSATKGWCHKFYQSRRSLEEERDNLRIAMGERLSAALPDVTIDDLRAVMIPWLSRPIEERGPIHPAYFNYERAFREGYDFARSRLKGLHP